MASYTGQLAPTIFHDIGALRPSFFSAPIPLSPTDGWSTTGASAGVRTGTQPVDENPRAFAGYGAFNLGYGGIFYNRIQISPSVVDLGNLLTTQARQVSLWNAFLDNRPLESLSWANAEGVSIDTPVPVPSTLGPLQEVIYTITAVTDGPSTIDALYDWEVDGDHYFLRVIGNRIVVFPFLPDWQDGLEEGLGWKTSVERAYSGDEQRRELRNAARKTMDFNITILDRHDAARIENMLFGWQARNFAVPIATDRGVLTAGASLGTSTLTLNTTDLGFYSGQPALLIADDENYEAVDILTAATGLLTLARPLARTWPVGTPVYPVGVAHLPSQQPLQRESDYYITASLSWRFAVTDANANTPDAAAALTYDGDEVFLKKPDWSSRPGFSYDDAFVTFGADDIGLLEFDQTSDFPAIVRQHRYVFKTRAEITAFRQFLRRRRGRLVPVWLPSGNDDFIITEDVTASASGIVVRDNGYRAFVAAHAARRDIAIFLKGNSTPIIKRISETSDNHDGTINLVLETTVGTTFPASSVSRVSHINLFRLGSDDVTLQWLTRKVVAVTLNWVLVKE